MLLEPQDVELFFKLHRTLMFFVNQRLKVLPDDIASPEKFSSLSPNVRLKVRDAFLAHTDLIQSFVDGNPAHFSDDELDIVRSWQHVVPGTFYILRELAKYTVFLSTDNPQIAYGVLALTDPFDLLIGRPLPIMVQTVLLPFKDKIVYDGLMTSRNISFGPGIRRSFNESFKEAKARHGIVTSLPMSKEPLPPKPSKVKPALKPPSKVEKDEFLQAFIGLLDEFCKQHLNEEYAVLCRKLAETLGRKRP